MSSDHTIMNSLRVSGS